MVVTVTKGEKCQPSLTTASGTHAPRAPFCSGELIFNENFDKFDFSIWEHERTMAGGGVSIT